MAKQWPDLMTPGEVAAVFRVDPKTVTRWAAAKKLNSIKTLGGHRRFRKADVERLLEDDPPLDFDDEAEQPD